MKLYIDSFIITRIISDDSETVVKGSVDFNKLGVYLDTTTKNSYSTIYPIYTAKRADGRVIGPLSTLMTVDSSVSGYFGWVGSIDSRMLEVEGPLEITIAFICNSTITKTIGKVTFQIRDAIVSNEDILVIGDLSETVTSMQASIDAIAAGLNNKVDKADIGYIELTTDSGTLTADQLNEAQKKYCIINKTELDENILYYRSSSLQNEDDDDISFLYMYASVTNNNLTITRKIIVVDRETGAYTTISMNIQAYTTAKADELLDTKADRNNPNQTIVVGAFTLRGDTISASESVNVKASDNSTGIYLDEDDIELETDNWTFQLWEDLFNVEYHNRHYVKLDDNGYNGVFETFVKNDTNGKSKFTQTTDDFTFYFNDDGTENSVKITPTSVKVNNNILAEKSYVDTQDNNLQSQIDGLNAGQNLADIVADLTALNNLSVTNLKDGDKVQVLVDSNHDNASTVYKLVVSGSSHSWSYIGKYGQDGYTKAEENALLATKQDVIDSSHKLSADLVDDTGHTNKFVTAEEKAQITTNANAIAGIKDGTTIDSFSDVESAISDITLSADNTSIEINSKVISVKSSYIDNQFLTDAEMETLISEVFE